MSNFSSGQDWEVAGWGSQGNSAGPKRTQNLNQARRSGNISTEAKHNAGTNRSAHATSGNMRKLEEDNDTYKHAEVDKSLSKALQQARLAKGMNQKALATAINEKPQVVGEYESGRAIPNGQIIAKLERALGTKLPRGGKKKTKSK